VFLHYISLIMVFYAIFTPLIYCKLFTAYSPFNQACVFRMLVTSAGAFH
jgi:hypothetical protein